MNKSAANEMNKSYVKCKDTTPMFRFGPAPREILEFLKSNKEILRVKYGVSKIGLFGSYARGNETENSDIDFYVEFYDKSFRNLSDLYLFLENKMGKKVDIVTGHKRMKKALKNSINRNIIYA